MRSLFVQTSYLLMTVIGLAGCAGEDISEDADSPEKAQVVFLERQFKMARYYDCNGELAREGWDTVSPPTKVMEIKPKSHSVSAIVHSTIYNQTNGERGSILNHTKFVIDLSPSVLNLQVREGINEIAFEFHFADQESETGSRFINVKYQERRLEGINEYHPDPELCPAE